MRILFAGGGTGGHINPAIAIANRACERYKDAEILFAGTKRGLEKDMVPNAVYEYITQNNLTEKVIKLLQK